MYTVAGNKYFDGGITMTISLVTTGDESVIDAFYSDSSRLAIVACAGGNRNAMTAGAYVSMRRRRLVQVPIAFAGVSSGIATTAFFMGNGIAPDIKVFSNDMSDSRMFDIRRRFLGKHPFDVDYVDRVFRGTETNRGIRGHQASQHGAPLYAVLGHSETGEPLIYRAQDAEDIWTLASYSTAITGFARPLTYRDTPVTDGYFTEQNLPVEWLVEKEEPSDVLVFAGRHYDPAPRVSHWLENMLYTSGFAPASRRVRELIRTRHIRFMKTAARAISIPHVRVLIVWMPERLPQINIREPASRELMRLGYWTMEELFRRRRL